MPQILTSYNSELSNSLKNFILPGIENAEQIKTQLLSLKVDSEEQIVKLNSILQRQIKVLLTEIMGKGQFQKVGKLIGLLCDVSIQQKYGRTHLEKPLINQSLAIIIVEEVLECLGINDLKEILPTITENICSFKQLDTNDQNRMLRIINHLLKRISKTEDYLIRGQLQFTLTKILPICHDSGFHYRIPVAKGIEIAKDQQAEQYEAAFSSQGITYQFYKDFWELQKYLMDPNQLSSVQSIKNVADQTPKKQDAAFRTEPVISLRLKHIQRVLNQVISYMKKHACAQSSPDFLAQPIKFLTNTHLLEFQLNDGYFRKIILIQMLVFTFTLKHLKPTGNILKNVMLTEVERQTISKIEQIALKYLEQIQASQFNSLQRGTQNLNLQSSLLGLVRAFLTNELEWLQLKDHWKEKKKVFLRIQVAAPEPQLKQKKSKQAINYNKKIAEIHSKIATQMNIQGDTLLNFLTEPFVPHIVNTPTQTSFAYYWSQGQSCLDSFDHENFQQHQFETKSEYNMFEWKALRSLYKESIKDISLGEKNPKLREYKALAFIDKKSKQLKDKPVKSNLEIVVPGEQKTTHLPTIQQVRQSKQVSSLESKERPSLEVQTYKEPTDLNGQADQRQEKDDAPSKKQKND